MELSSSAFKDGGAIPARYTCDGENVSPPLAWRDLPPGTEALALIVDDPDAPAKVWVHWLLYDFPPAPAELPEGVPAQGSLDNGASQGLNDFHELGYGGPCPPRGTHRYRFTLYALDGKLGLHSGASEDLLLQAIEGRVRGRCELTGKYTR